MSKGVALGLTVIGISLIALGGVNYGLEATQQAPTTTSRPLCTLPNDLDYSPGATIREGGQEYRCIFVHGMDLKPAGLTWVKTTMQGSVQVIQGAGR